MWEKSIIINRYWLSVKEGKMLLRAGQLIVATGSKY